MTLNWHRLAQSTKHLEIIQNKERHCSHGCVPNMLPFTIHIGFPYGFLKVYMNL